MRVQARNCVVRPGQRHLTIAPIDNVWSLNSSVFGPRMIDADTSSYWEMPPLFFSTFSGLYVHLL